MRPAIQEEHLDLEGVIRQVMETAKTADPEHLADAMLERLDGEAVRQVARMSLVEFVHVWLVEQRTPRPRAVPPASAPARPGAPNQRYTGLAAALLSQRHQVSGGRWKELGECLAEDLDFLAVEHRREAEFHGVQAAFFERLKAALETARARRVADLPADVLVRFAPGGAP